jgi:hypothetical protein
MGMTVMNQESRNIQRLLRASRSKGRLIRASSAGLNGRPYLFWTPGQLRASYSIQQPDRSAIVYANRPTWLESGRLVRDPPEMVYLTLGENQKDESRYRVFRVDYEKWVGEVHVTPEYGTVVTDPWHQYGVDYEYFESYQEAEAAEYSAWVQSNPTWSDRAWDWGTGYYERTTGRVHISTRSAARIIRGTRHVLPAFHEAKLRIEAAREGKTYVSILDRPYESYFVRPDVLVPAGQFGISSTFIGTPFLHIYAGTVRTSSYRLETAGVENFPSYGVRVYGTDAYEYSGNEEILDHPSQVDPRIAANTAISAGIDYQIVGDIKDITADQIVAEVERFFGWNLASRPQSLS